MNNFDFIGPLIDKWQAEINCVVANLQLYYTAPVATAQNSNILGSFEDQVEKLQHAIGMLNTLKELQAQAEKNAQQNG